MDAAHHSLALGAPVLLLAFQVPVAAQEKADGPDQVEIAIADGSDPADRFRAEQRVLRMGAKAVPRIWTLLRQSKGKSKQEDRAYNLLRRLGPDAVSALPDLMEKLQEDKAGSDAALQAFDELVVYAPDQKDAAIQMLSDLWMARIQNRARRNLITTTTITRSRTRLDVDRSMKLPELIEILDSGNPWQLEVAANLIADAPGDDSAKVKALLRHLEKGGTQRRVRVQFKSANMSASINSSVSDTAPARRSIARTLLRLMTPKDIPATVWVTLLDDEDPAILRRAMHGVAFAGDARGTSKLILLTRHASPGVRREAITTLGMLGTKAKGAVSTLRTLSRSEDKATAALAQSALRSITGDSTTKTGR